MTADLVIDLENHIEHGNLWLVELEMPYEDDDATGVMNVDVYITATTLNQAMYIANSMYPDNLGCSGNHEPVTEEIYASRRNRSLF